MANAGPVHIQLQQDKDTATIPLFYGNAKDTVTLQCFIQRIDTGIRTLQWTQNVAFTYFQNACRSTAAAWLESFLTDNPDIVPQWQTVKPHFRKAFGDTTDPIVFAQEVFNIRPQQYGNSLFDYYNAISQAVKLHQEEFVPPPLPPLPEEQEFDQEQIAFITNLHQTSFKTAVQAVHAKLRKEFFLNGLSKTQLDLVTNKPHLTMVHEMIAALHQHESVEKKKNGNSTQSATIQSLHTKTEPDNKPDEVAATFQSQRGNQNFRGQNRGSNYRGNQSYQTYRGSGNGYRGTNNCGGGGTGAGAGAGYRQTQTQYSQSQNNAQTQNNSQNNRTNGPGKTCIYCRKPGHIQDFCFNRIDRSDPCIDSQGKSYWPKVNSNEEISSSSVFFLEN